MSWQAYKTKMPCNSAIDRVPNSLTWHKVDFNVNSFETEKTRTNSRTSSSGGFAYHACYCSHVGVKPFQLTWVRAGLLKNADTKCIFAFQRSYILLSCTCICIYVGGFALCGHWSMNKKLTTMYCIFVYNIGLYKYKIYFISKWEQWLMWYWNMALSGGMK